MHKVVEIDKYSEEFEQLIAEYATGIAADRSEKTVYEIYTKIKHALMFLDFCDRYFLLSGKRFMEIGCGTAIFSTAAAIRGAEVSATDFVEKAVSLAAIRWKEHGIDGDLFVSDLRDNIAPQRIGAFDAVFCYQVIEHIPRRDQIRALANLFRMVAPGGFLFIDTENSLAPFDRHDSRLWLLRYLTKPVYEEIFLKLGRGLNFFEPSTGARVQSHDYLSYDEITAAAEISGFKVASPFMPHGDKAQMLRSLTGSDWLHDNLLAHVDLERFAPVSLLLQRTGAALV